MSKLRQCSKKHKVEVICIDLSKPYNNENYKEMYQVRCAVPANTCQFSDYYRRKLDAELDWNGIDITALQNMKKLQETQ